MPFLFKTMNITDYLKTIGFKRVEQSDEYGRFLDPDYVCLNGLYAELHDDGMFFMWTDPYNVLIEMDTKEHGAYIVKLQATMIIDAFHTPITIKH